MTAILIMGLACAVIGSVSSYRISRRISEPKGKQSATHMLAPVKHALRIQLPPVLDYDPRVCQCGHPRCQHTKGLGICTACKCEFYTQADERTARKAKVNQ